MRIRNDRSSPESHAPMHQSIVRTSVLLIFAFMPVLANAQSKPIVAIGGMDTSAQNVSCEGWDRAVHDCNQDLSEGFRVMLETSIIKTGKMNVMERGRVDAWTQS